MKRSSPRPQLPPSYWRNHETYEARRLASRQEDHYQTTQELVNEVDPYEQENEAAHDPELLKKLYGNYNIRKLPPPPPPNSGRGGGGLFGNGGYRESSMATQGRGPTYSFGLPPAPTFDPEDEIHLELERLSITQGQGPPPSYKFPNANSFSNDWGIDLAKIKMSQPPINPIPNNFDSLSRNWVVGPTKMDPSPTRTPSNPRTHTQTQKYWKSPKFPPKQRPMLRTATRITLEFGGGHLTDSPGVQANSKNGAWTQVNNGLSSYSSSNESGQSHSRAAPSKDPQPYPWNYGNAKGGVDHNNRGGMGSFNSTTPNVRDRWSAGPRFVIKTKTTTTTSKNYFPSTSAMNTRSYFK